VVDDTDRLKGFLYEKKAKRKKQMHPEHPEHSLRFNHDIQLEIDCIEWALQKIEVNKIPNDRLERVIRATIKNLEKRKDKAMIRTDTDNLWTKIESLQWVLFVIFAIKNGKNGCDLNRLIEMHLSFESFFLKIYYSSSKEHVL
jgi:hypothetical protein